MLSQKKRHLTGHWIEDKSIPSKQVNIGLRAMLLINLLSIGDVIPAGIVPEMYPELGQWLSSITSASRTPPDSGVLTSKLAL